MKAWPSLQEKAAFKAFVITDTISFMCSSYSAFVYFLTGIDGHVRILKYLNFANKSLVLAQGTMMISFITGIYAALQFLSVSQDVSSFPFILFFPVLSGCEDFQQTSQFRIKFVQLRNVQQNCLSYLFLCLHQQTFVFAFVFCFQ